MSSKLACFKPSKLNVTRQTKRCDVARDRTLDYCPGSGSGFIILRQIQHSNLSASVSLIFPAALFLRKKLCKSICGSDARFFFWSKLRWHHSARANSITKREPFSRLTEIRHRRNIHLYSVRTCHGLRWLAVFRTVCYSPTPTVQLRSIHFHVFLAKRLANIGEKGCYCRSGLMPSVCNPA